MLSRHPQTTSSPRRARTRTRTRALARQVQILGLAVLLATLNAAMLTPVGLPRVAHAQPPPAAVDATDLAEDTALVAATDDGAEPAVPPEPPAPAVTEAPPPAAPAAVPAPEPAPLATVGPSFPTPIKGVWVHVLDSVLLSRGSIATMLDNVAAAGGNTVVVEVVRRYDAYYNSQFLPRGNDPGFEPGLDVLAEVIAGAAARGLSVHAWMTAMPAWTPEAAADPSLGHWLFSQHGRDVPPEQSWLTFTAAGQPTDFLDPGHPDVQDLVVATAAELATYDIDAVHLDYLRYPGADTGYNPVALGRFQAETGRTDIPAPDDPQFSDWRRQQTTTVMQRIHDTVTAVNPDVGISAALITWGDGPVGGRPFEATPAWNQVYQPWPAWAAQGLIDVAMPMLYFRENRHASFHRNWMSYAAGLRQATGVLMAPGQGSWLNDVDASLTQLGAAAPFVDGEVLFSYQETASGQGQALLPALAGSLWHPERLLPAPAAEPPPPAEGDAPTY